MNVIPKFQQGGGFDSFFTQYQSVQAPTSKVPQQTSSISYTSKDKDDNSKSRLTEKDFFNMIKEIDGLPNDMEKIVNSLVKTFQISNLTGLDLNSIQTTYLSSLYQLKVAKQNKAKFDKAIEHAQTAGSLQEPAIYGRQVLAQTEDGEIHPIDLDTYFNNKDKYSLLTVSNVAYLRENDPSFSFNQKAIDIINNGIGFEEFQNLIDLAKAKLGTSSNPVNGYFSIEGQASKGLELIEQLKQAGILNDLDLAQLKGSVTAEGLYDYGTIDKNQLGQIKALTSYLKALMPSRAKIWAALKLQTPNEEKAIESLIFQYLISENTTEHSIKTHYNGTMEHAMGKSGKSDKSGNSSVKDGDYQEGFWRQVQSGKGGTETAYKLIVKNGSMTLPNGKYYGKTPGPDSSCSLEEYLSKSNLGYVNNNRNGILFGDVELSKDSFSDVMVNINSGAFVVTLPVKNGQVWIDAVEVYSDFDRELKKSGLDPNSSEYQKKVQELLKNPKYSSLVPLIQSNGRLNPSNSAHFLVLEGITSSKGTGISDRTGKEYSFDDIKSNYIVKVNDDNLRQVLIDGLTNEKRKYELNGWPNEDKLYKGNIYIPLSTNPIDAMNADENNIKASMSKTFEEAQQEWTKSANIGMTNSEALQQ